jgi:hypothetical protein
MAFYSKYNDKRFLHILIFLCFNDNTSEPDKSDEYNKLWKMRTIFGKLNDAYAN